MKNLMLINGTMGVGKSTVSNELKKILPNSVFLDGDWCWDMSPFVVTEETKTMVLNNITYLLNNFIACSAFQNIIFCWVMHEQSILDDILLRLNQTNCTVYKFSLICSEQALISRLTGDIEQGLRNQDIIERSVPRLKSYVEMDTMKIDVSDISAKDAAKIIANQIKTD